jgi:hypothetical protein
MPIAICICLAQVDSVAVQNSNAWKRHTIDSSSLGADGVRAADANGDRSIGLVTSWEQGGVTRAYLASRTNGGEPAWQNLLLDVDRDGDLDVINSEENDNARGGKPGLGVVWYENPTRARFSNRR